MKRILIAACIVLGAGLLDAAEPAKPKPKTKADKTTDKKKKEDKVHPAAYRILVKYDKYTVDMIRKHIDKEIKEALAARRRRLKLSREAMETQLKKERERFEKELEAIRKARKEAEDARRRGDLGQAKKWTDIARRRTDNLFDLLRRGKLIEDALLAMSLDNWLAAQRKQRIIAAKALQRLEGRLAQTRAKKAAERAASGAALLPPHE